MIVIRNYLPIILLVFLSKTGNARNLIEEAPKKALQGFLGETAFLIPSNIINNVEYDGDPSWGVSKKIEVKNRNKFRSFGLKMNFPDFNFLLKTQNFEESTISISVAANSYYGDGNFLNSSFKRINRDPLFKYNESHQIYGLRHFPLEISKSVQRIEPMRNFDVYVKLNNDKEVETLIRCGNSQGEKSLCSHFIQINELKTHLELMYKRKLLPEWDLIQKKSISNLKSFEIKEIK